MRRQYGTVIIVIALFLVLFSLPVTGCGQAALSDDDLKDAYAHAINDARIAEPGEIYRDLEPITWYNADLEWEGARNQSRVLMVTWTAWDGYKDAAGADLALSREVWVVIPEELKDFYRDNKGLSGDSLVLRLEQLYGLPPHNGKQWFVEMWVTPADLFRPSPDPDITDCEAELDFPAWVDADYRDWFNALESASYGENGYPWTRLGYTYDWGSEDTEIGLSEFVIRAGSTVGINAVTGSQDYLKN